MVLFADVQTFGPNKLNVKENDTTGKTNLTDTTTTS